MIPAWLEAARGTDGIGKLLGNRHVTAAPKKGRAAVLMLFSGASLEEGEVLLTHRSPSLRSHSGQIAFPGGRLDPGETAVDAALREATEETGLDPATATVMEEWEPLHIRATGNPVSPVLAYWHSPQPVYPASPEETDHVFNAPLRELLDPANRLTVGRGPWRGPAFWHDGYLIWGFTAGVLAGTFRYAGWERDWDGDTVHDVNEVIARSRNNEKMW